MRPRPMTWLGRRRGFFEAPPRLVYRHIGARYFDACAVGIVANGVVASAFGVVALALYVELRAGELAILAAAMSVAFALEGGAYLRRRAAPARAWLAGQSTEDAAPAAWSAAAQLPLALLRRPSLYVIGALGTARMVPASRGRTDAPPHAEGNRTSRCASGYTDPQPRVRER